VLAYLLDPPERVHYQDMEVAAASLGMTLSYHRLREPAQLDEAFAAMVTEGAEALVVIPHAFMGINAKRIVGLAMQSKLPAVFPFREHAQVGGCSSTTWTAPGSTAVSAPTPTRSSRARSRPTFQWNSRQIRLHRERTHREGARIAIPQAMLLRADEVIQ